MAAPTTEYLVALAARGGVALAPDEIERLRPAIVRSLEMLVRLAELPLEGIEPPVQYRIL